jgi:alpha-tubulin suppressor-like RCC1 family protein
MVFLFFVFKNINGQCWTMVDSESHRTMGIKTDGTLWGWGLNGTYQLGNGNTANLVKPTQIGISSDWKLVSCGGAHTIAIKNDGTLWSWGYNVSGQLGDGKTTIKTTPSQIGSDTDWIMISGGNVHSLAIKKNGTLWAWGDNSKGQLGDGYKINQLVPKQIGKDSDWVAISAGQVHSLALKTNHTLWGWGDNSSCQYGFMGSCATKLQPSPIGNDTNWNQIYAGNYFSMMVKRDGTLWAQGDNQYCQLGDGTSGDKTTPTRIIRLSTDCQSISVGVHHVICIKKDKSMVSWGLSNHGELGIGIPNYSKECNPTQIGTDFDWSYISVDEGHSVALKTDGTLWSWGYNRYGQVGDGTLVDRNFPKSIPCNLMNYSSIKIQQLYSYPNPTRGKINVKIMSNTSEENLKNYIIQNCLGEIVMIGRLGDELTEVDLVNFRNGVYLLSVGHLQQKIILNK